MILERASFCTNTISIEGGRKLQAKMKQSENQNPSQIQFKMGGVLFVKRLLKEITTKDDVVFFITSVFS